MGISALCIVIELQQRFDKHRVHAFALFMSTASIGSIVSSYCMGLLIETFGWRGTMFLNAAIMLHSVACSLLLNLAAGKQIKNKCVASSQVDEKMKAAAGTRCYHGKQLISTFSLFCRDFDLVLFCVIRLLASIAGYAVMAHMSLRAVDSNMTLVKATQIVAYVNAVLLVSRLLTAIINLFQCVNNILVAAICSLASGLALSLSCLSDEYMYIVWMICYTIYALLWGKLHSLVNGDVTMC